MSKRGTEIVRVTATPLNLPVGRGKSKAPLNPPSLVAALSRRR